MKMREIKAGVTYTSYRGDKRRAVLSIKDDIVRFQDLDVPDAPEARQLSLRTFSAWALEESK